MKRILNIKTEYFCKSGIISEFKHIFRYKYYGLYTCLLLSMKIKIFVYQIR